MFRIKDLGPLKYFLGIEVARSQRTLFMLTKIYVEYINRMWNAQCQACGLSDGTESPAQGCWWSQSDRRCHVSMTCGSPHLPHHHETRNLLCCTRALSLFAYGPWQEHLDAAYRVLRYLKGNPGQRILLWADCDLRLYAFCDSDWASCPVTRRSVTGYFVTLEKSPVSWKTKKQVVVSGSSAKAEFRAMATATSELTWLKGFLKSLGVAQDRSMIIFLR